MPKKKPLMDAERKSIAKTTAKSKPSFLASGTRPPKSPTRSARARNGKTAMVAKPAKASRSKPAPAGASMPSTIARSDRHAQSLWRKALASAEKTYGDGARAHRVAYGALKHEYEKSGNCWVRKDEAGPSDARAARGPTTRPSSTEAPARTGRGHVVRKSGSPTALHAKPSGR